MEQYKIITGTAKQVEKEINDFNKEYFLVIMGITATNEQTTVIIELLEKRE